MHLMNSSARDRAQTPADTRHAGGFAANWLAGNGIATRATRRRVLAILRMAHRALGMDRKRLGLGSLGAAGVAALLISIGVGGVAQAQYAAGGGTGTQNGQVSIGGGTAAT